MGKVIGAVLMVSTLSLVLLASSDEAGAQAPAHRPGTICLTPQFWCWAQPPGRPGTPCFCQTPFSRVRGTLG